MSIEIIQTSKKTLYMKTKNIFGVLLLFICMFGFANCSDGNEKTEIYHLSFEKDYYERPILGAKSIMIRGGNRNYTIKVEDPQILEVTVDLSSPTNMGDLKILPKQKGETNIEVRDNVTKEVVNLKIKIINSYLNLAVANPIMSPFKQGDEFFLINNDDKSCYLYDENLNLKHTGNYKFSIENNVPYMELTYHKEFEGRTKYKYDLTGTNQNMFDGIKYILNWDWRDFIESSTTKEVSPIIMNATDTETNTEYYLVAKGGDIPENVLE